MTDIDKQLRDLSLLKDGWHDEEPDSKAPTPAALAVVEDAVLRLDDVHGFDAPHLCPTLDGGVRVEWDVHEWSVEVTVTPDGKSVILNASAQGRFRPGRLVTVETTPPQMGVILATLRHVLSSA